MHPIRLVAPLIATLALLLASIAPVTAQTPVARETNLYIGQQARLTTALPSGWTYDPSLGYGYSNQTGFVTSFVVAGATLDEACAAPLPYWSDPTTANTTWRGQPACRIDGTYIDRPARALILPHPYPFAIYGETYFYVAVITDPGHYSTIADSISFDPTRVTPHAHLASVLDIVEASAWFGQDIDWAWFRPYILDSIDDDATIESVQGSISTILNLLRSYGDNHSFVLYPDQSTALLETRGFGMVIGGTRIIAIFPAGPAALAGLQVGDVILTVNGETASNFPGMDPGTGWYPTDWQPRSTLTVERPGEPSPLEVTLTSTTFEYYRPPVGHALGNGLGYIDIPGYRIPGREVEFSQTGIDLLSTIDRQQPTCGWVVDLRLNFGGSYSPMVSAISPLVGNGTFVGWLDRSNHTTWIAMEDGTITSDGETISSYLPNTGPALLSQPNPPIAVLTSGQTGSSGEVTTLAFVGNPSARSFGEITGGYSTANRGFALFDGTMFGLATSAMVDRNGMTHLDGIRPDESIAIDWTTYGTADDPVLIAAQEWLLTQPSCSSH